MEYDFETVMKMQCYASSVTSGGVDSNLVQLQNSRRRKDKLSCKDIISTTASWEILKMIKEEANDSRCRAACDDIDVLFERIGNCQSRGEVYTILAKVGYFIAPSECTVGPGNEAVVQHLCMSLIDDVCTNEAMSIEMCRPDAEWFRALVFISGLVTASVAERRRWVADKHDVNKLIPMLCLVAMDTDVGVNEALETALTLADQGMYEEVYAIVSCVAPVLVMTPRAANALSGIGDAIMWGSASVYGAEIIALMARAVENAQWAHNEYIKPIFYQNMAIRVLAFSLNMMQLTEAGARACTVNAYDAMLRAVDPELYKNAGVDAGRGAVTCPEPTREAVRFHYMLEQHGAVAIDVFLVSAAKVVNESTTIMVREHSRIVELIVNEASKCGILELAVFSGFLRHTQYTMMVQDVLWLLLNVDAIRNNDDLAARCVNMAAAQFVDDERVSAWITAIITDCARPADLAIEDKLATAFLEFFSFEPALTIRLKHAPLFLLHDAAAPNGWNATVNPATIATQIPNVPIKLYDFGTPALVVAIATVITNPNSTESDASLVAIGVIDQHKKLYINTNDCIKILMRHFSDKDALCATITDHNYMALLSDMLEHFRHPDKPFDAQQCVAALLATCSSQTRGSDDQINTMEQLLFVECFKAIITTQSEDIRCYALQLFDALSSRVTTLPLDIAVNAFKNKPEVLATAENSRISSIFIGKLPAFDIDPPDALKDVFSLNFSQQFARMNAV